MQYEKTLTTIISQALLSSVYVALASIIEHMYSQSLQLVSCALIRVVRWRNRIT